MLWGFTLGASLPIIGWLCCMYRLPAVVLHALYVRLAVQYEAGSNCTRCTRRSPDSTLYKPVLPMVIVLAQPFLRPQCCNCEADLCVGQSHICAARPCITATLFDAGSLTCSPGCLAVQLWAERGSCHDGRRRRVCLAGTSQLNQCHSLAQCTVRLPHTQ